MTRTHPLHNRTEGQCKFVHDESVTWNCPGTPKAAKAGGAKWGGLKSKVRTVGAARKQLWFRSKKDDEQHQQHLKHTAETIEHLQMQLGSSFKHARAGDDPTDGEQRQIDAFRHLCTRMRKMLMSCSVVLLA